MEVVEGQSPQVNDEKTIDETTVFFSENGTVSKRQRRKSLGRRVSFAEAPKLHIFARDDEYVTPTRATNGAGSPHRVGGERRSPRLAAKVVDADKENRVLASNPAPKRGRRKGGSKPLAAREEEDPALKPHNWLDARDPLSQAGDDENTGPVDLRHLSFDQQETEMDEDNLTLDSTTFALRSLQQIRSVESAAVVQLDTNRPGAVSADEDGVLDEEHDLEEVLVKDMSFTMNKPVRRRKPVRESITGLESTSSDTVMSMNITMLVSRRHKMAQMLVGGDNINVDVEEDSVTVSPQNIPPRKFMSRGTREDNSALVLYSNDMQNGPAKGPLAEDVRAFIEERYGDLGDDTGPVQRHFQGALKSPLGGIPGAKDLPAQLDENFGDGGDETQVQMEKDSMTVNPQKILAPRKFILDGSRDENSAEIIGSHNLQKGRAPVPRADDVRALLDERFGDLGEGTSPVQRDVQRALKLPLRGTQIPREEDLPAELEEKFGDGGDDIYVQVEQDSMTVSPQKVPPPGNSILHRSRDENSAEIHVSQDLQNGPALVPRAEELRALREERSGERIGDDTSLAKRNSQSRLESPLQGIKIPRAEDLRAPLEEKTDSSGDALKLPLKGIIVPRVEDVPAQSEERFGRHLVDLDEDTNLTRGSGESLDPIATVDMSFCSPRSVGKEDRSITMGIPSLGQLLRKDEDEEDEESSSIGHIDRSITMGIPSLRHLIREQEEHEEMGVEEQVEIDTKHRARETLNSTEEVEMTLTGEEFIGIDSRATIQMEESPGPKFAKHRARETLSPTEEVEMMLTEEEFTGIDSRATIKMESPGSNFAKHRARQTLNPTEEAEMMLTEEEFSGIDSRATIKMEESPGPNFAKHRTREALNPTEEAEMMLTEEEFSWIDSRATRTKEESPGPNFAKHRARKALNRTEDAEMILTVEEFTGTDRRATIKQVDSLGPTFAKHRAREILNPTEDAGMVLTEEPVTGLDSRATTNHEESPGPISDIFAMTSTKLNGGASNMDGKKSNRRIISSDSLEATEMMLTRERLSGIDNRPTAHLEEFTGPDYDNRAMKRAKFERGGTSVDNKESDNNCYPAVGKWSTTEDNHFSTALESVTPQVPRSSDLLGAEMKSLHSTPVRPARRSMWMTPPSSVITARAKDESSPEREDDIYDTTAAITERIGERIGEDGEESISATKVSVEEEDVPHLIIKSEDTTALISERVPEDEEEGISVTKMSVDEFLQHAEVQFSLGHQGPRDLGKDPSLVETHHVRSLSEIFNFLCLVKPQLIIMSDACAELHHENSIKATAVTELEQPLTAIFSNFQKAPEGEKQRLRKQLERIQGNYSSLAEKDRIHFQLIVENDITKELLKMKDNMMYYVEHIQEQRNIFQEKCCRPFRCLQSSLSSRDANLECISTSQSKLSTVKHLRTTANLERIEDLKKRLEDLKSSLELKSGKSRPREQAAEESLERLKQRVARSKNKLSDLRSQLVETICSGENNLRKEEVAHSPYLGVEKMKSEVSFLHNLQDGFQVKSAGRENQDMVVELSYRSLVKRRYVVRKVGTAVKVLRSTWSLEQEKLEEIFPKINALVVFSFALQTSGTSKGTSINSAAWPQKFGRLRASEAVRFTLPSDKPGGIPEPTSLRESMQFTRILVGNLMNLVEEIGQCQLVINASSGGGVLAEARFRNDPDGHLQLELKFIDCVSSIKFFLYLDMTCLPMNGYPLGDLPAKVEVAYCAPPVRHRFKPETLETLLSLVKPGYQRLERTYAAVGSFLASLRRGVST